MSLTDIVNKAISDNTYLKPNIENNNKENEVVFDFMESTISDLDRFDTLAWSKGDGYCFPKYPKITSYLEGLEEGLYLVCGESNTGKSALMMNLLYDLCMHSNNKLFGIYYSLDDTKFEIIPRIIAMDQSIPIGVGAKPQRYQNLIDQGDENAIMYMQYIEARKTGLEKLRSNNNHFKIEDSESIKTAEDIFTHMKQLQHYVKSIDPEMNIVVAIDALDDIRFANKHFGSTTDRHAEIARTVKQWVVDLHVPIFGSRHLSKLRQNRRPNLDDLKDSNEYVYEASVVWLVHNDVSKNKQAANVYYSAEGTVEKLPVLEIDWAKNKKSSFKGRTYAYFIPEYSKATECNDNDTKRYDVLVYAN